jgi:hypothetical protein
MEWILYYVHGFFYRESAAIEPRGANKKRIEDFDLYSNYLGL